MAAKVSKVAEEVVGARGLRAQRLSELRVQELLWFPPAFFLQPPSAQALGWVTEDRWTEPESLRGTDVATCAG